MIHSFILRLTICWVTVFTVLQGGVTIKGTIVDIETNQPIIGVNVLIVGTDQGAITDERGRFTIERDGTLPITLKISHIAYIEREFNIIFITPLKIRLVTKILKGERVIVTGERSRSNAEVSTAMDIVDVGDMEIQGARELGSAIRRISSVVVDHSVSGMQTVSIRGSNPNEVAVYLDGVKINSANTGIADLSQIDLNSIRKVEVLRSGNAYLFGQGNLGGVVNLESRDATKNSLSIAFGEGLSFDDDLDLSVNGTGVVGPLGVGGRFSGRSRAYAGRTVTSSAFNNIFGHVSISPGIFNGRWYYLKNMLTFPSGEVITGDEQSVFSTEYKGSIGRFTEWDIFAGMREWSETNNFFDNLDQRLKDENLSFRVSKSFNLKSMKGTFQIEREEQTFTGEKTQYWADPERTVDTRDIIVRNTDAIAVVTRWNTEGGIPILRRMQLELSVRYDKINTSTSISNVNVLTGMVINDTDIQIDGWEKARFFSRRIGVRMEGMTNKFGYRFFFAQGNNKRLPTLNDLFLKTNTNFDSLRMVPIEPEILNSTELNIQISFTEFLTTPIISELLFKGAYFRNNYDNKIGYLEVKGFEEVDEPPFPYNEPEADIRGFEAGIQASFFDQMLRLETNHTLLDIENPFIFPNRPGSRTVTTVELDLDWLVVSYDSFKESEQFIMGNSFGLLFEPREDSNLSVTLREKIRGLNLSLTYTIRNLKSRDVKEEDPNLSLLFFNYYQQYREILTLRVEL